LPVDQPSAAVSNFVPQANTRVENAARTVDSSVLVVRFDVLLREHRSKVIAEQNLKMLHARRSASFRHGRH
jgi:hypothetical protein